MKKIVLFGGTFDPPHKGHIAIYDAIKREIKPDLFIIIPTKVPPLKDSLAFASPKDRVMMLKLAFGSSKGVKISDFELNKKTMSPSYSIDTVKHFHKKFPGATLFFAIGYDRYLDFQSWKSWREILKLVKLIVINRGDKKSIKAIDDTIIEIKMPPINISSTQLRSMPDKTYLPIAVSKYIAKNNLYIEQQVKSLMSSKRYSHSVRVAKLAVELASKVDKKLIQKAFVAAMYHDIAKEFDNAKILKLVGKYDHSRFPTVHTLHGMASAKYAANHYYLNDKIILNAIANHVIPSRNPSVLDKIIYCADKLEPARTKADVSNRENYITLAKRDIDKAFIKLQAETISRYI